MEAWRQSLGLLAFLVLIGLCGPAAADLVTFHDAQRGISFSYDDRAWKGMAADPERLISIERRLLGGELIGICSLKARKSAYAASMEGHVHEERERITQDVTKQVRERRPEAPAVESKPVMAGTQQLLEVRVHRQYDAYDVPDGTTFILLFTAYRGEEIIFTCGYPDMINRPTTKEPPIETEIRGIMKTLSFAD